MPAYHAAFYHCTGHWKIELYSKNSIFLTRVVCCKKYIRFILFPCYLTKLYYNYHHYYCYFTFLVKCYMLKLIFLKTSHPSDVCQWRSGSWQLKWAMLVLWLAHGWNRALSFHARRTCMCLPQCITLSLLLICAASQGFSSPLLIRYFHVLVWVISCCIDTDSALFLRKNCNIPPVTCKTISRI